MNALAIGISESVNDAYIASRVKQVVYLHEQLTERGVPLVNPCGGHGV